MAAATGLFRIIEQQRPSQEERVTVEYASTGVFGRIFGSSSRTRSSPPHTRRLRSPPHRRWTSRPPGWNVFRSGKTVPVDERHGPAAGEDAQRRPGRRTRRRRAAAHRAGRDERALPYCWLTRDPPRFAQQGARSATVAPVGRNARTLQQPARSQLHGRIGFPAGLRHGQGAGPASDGGLVGASRQAGGRTGPGGFRPLRAQHALLRRAIL